MLFHIVLLICDNKNNKSKFSDFNKLIDYFFDVQAGLIHHPIQIAEINNVDLMISSAIYQQTLIAVEYSNSSRNLYLKKKSMSQSQQEYCYSPYKEMTDFTGELGQQIFYFLMHRYEQENPKPEIVFEEHPAGIIFRNKHRILYDLLLTNIKTNAIAPIEIKTTFISDNKLKCNAIATKEDDFRKHKRKNERIYVLVYVRGNWKDFKSLTYQIFAAPISYIEEKGSFFYYVRNKTSKLRIIDLDDLLQDSKFIK